METSAESPSCSVCGSYAHPFLGACPVCGVVRTSRYEDALASPDLGFRALTADPYVDEQVRQVVLRYTMKRNRDPEETRLRQGLAIIANILLYRVTVAGERAASTDRGHVELTDEALLIREKSPTRDIHRVPLDRILAVAHAGTGRPAGAWAGLVFDGRLDPAAPPPLDGDLVVTYAGDRELGRLALANRRGIFVARARADHFEIVGSWLGMLAAAAAEARWSVVGSRDYAAQLGLTAGDGYAPRELPAAGPGRAEAAGPGPASGAPAGTEPPVAGSTSVREALEELEELRAARLVTDEEYAEKRREILARL